VHCIPRSSVFCRFEDESFQISQHDVTVMNGGFVYYDANYGNDMLFPYMYELSGQYFSQVQNDTSQDIIFTHSGDEIATFYLMDRLGEVKTSYYGFTWKHMALTWSRLSSGGFQCISAKKNLVHSTLVQINHVTYFSHSPANTWFLPLTYICVVLYHLVSDALE
jgi:hypothetical protein